jgi:hypothetical protein
MPLLQSGIIDVPSLTQEQKSGTIEDHRHPWHGLLVMAILTARQKKRTVVTSPNSELFQVVHGTYRREEMTSQSSLPGSPVSYISYPPRKCPLSLKNQFRAKIRQSQVDHGRRMKNISSPRTGCR